MIFIMILIMVLIMIIPAILMILMIVMTVVTVCDDCDGLICGSTCGQKVEMHNNLQSQRFTEFTRELKNG
jgi:hypothetical protein